MGSKRILVGLALGVFCIAPGCANVVGLGDFTVAGSGGAGTVKGGDMSGGPSTGGTSGTAGRNGASAGANNGAEAGLAEAGASADAGSGGAPDLQCTTSCDDQNECTDDSCVAGQCVNQPVGAGKSCGTGLTCNAQGVCVRCRDTAAGTAKDEGCSAGAPICVGTGAAATCSGCTTNTDCNDNNDCTSETCSNGSCAFSPLASGQACATGVCNGVSGSEKCVACADDAPVSKKDSGCTDSAKPICDVTGTPGCFACVVDADCDDGVSCTNEKCMNHVCSHTADDTKCTPSGDLCKPNRCDAVASCKQVVLTPTSNPVISSSTSVGNGSFEAVTVVGTNHEAQLWDNPGDDYVIYSCTPCKSSAGSTPKDPNGGNYAAWFAGTTYAATDELQQAIQLPVGTTSLHIQADTNVQTKSTAAMNADSFAFRLLDANFALIGAPVATFSNVGAQTTTVAWTSNGIDKTVDVTAQSGTLIYVDLWSQVDATLPTDFFIDNVRVTATVCN